MRKIEKLVFNASNKAQEALNKVSDIESKSSITLNHQFADITARDTYFTANPTELVEKLFIKVGTEYQQYINGIWEVTSAVIIEQPNANQMSIIDEGNLYNNTDVEGALQEVATDLAEHKLDYANLVDEVTELAYITQKYTIDSWQKVQDIVRAGLASKAFKVGDQFIANYNSVPFTWDIIGIDHDIPTDTAYTHSLTIQTRDCLQNVQFDAPEPTNTDANRQQYGNNRYIHSAIKQWLNSNQSVFTWVSQHQYDAAPTGAPYTGAGFLKLLDPELVAVIGAVNKQVAKATVDGGGQYLFSDKVFLLSTKEVYGTNEGVVTGEDAYPYYSVLAGAATIDALAGRIKYLAGSAHLWWLRSPVVTSSDLPSRVSTTGSVYYSGAYGASGLAPACCIV